MKEGEDPLSALVTLVVVNYRKYSRGPYRVNDALEKAEQADESSTERILVEKSQLAWRAYLAAKKTISTDRGYSGKADLTRLLNHLNAQPIHRRRDFADELASAMENVEVNASTQGAKRRRIAIEASVQPTAITSNADTSLIDTDLSVTEQIPDLSASRDVYVGAPLEPAEELFHDQFWDSVERTQSKEQPGVLLADISMLFQQGYIREHFGCQMEIGIAKEKVTDLAFQYFGVKLEIKDGVRSVCYPGGGKIEPDPSIKLRACQRDLSGIFRGDLYEGAHTSPIYQREKIERRNRTDGVSMTISNQAKEGAKITVFLGEWRASAIKKNFYG
ncbi:hypothetical protein FPOAC2_13600 [Fusarium poae]|uniref:Uncharacterized protein n=1 Tax=Fusarium poae TaxID=36050 RepID=A0A1B8AIH5_FUSPO|nr:hypothetical protein FPOA_06675 [Fusarium poae]